MFKSIRLIMQEMDKVNMHYNVEDMGMSIFSVQAMV